MEYNSTGKLQDEHQCNRAENLLTEEHNPSNQDIALSEKIGEHTNWTDYTSRPYENEVTYSNGPSCMLHKIPLGPRSIWMKILKQMPAEVIFTVSRDMISRNYLLHLKNQTPAAMFRRPAIEALNVAFVLK